MLKNTKTYQNIIWLKSFLRKLNIRPIYLAIAVFLSLGAAFFEGISVFFLIPLAEGIVAMNFNSAKQALFIKNFILWFPEIFANSNTALFILLVIVIFISAVLKNIIQYAAFLAISKQFRRFCNNLRKLIFSRYLSFGKLFFDNNSMGYLQNVLLNFTGFIGVELRDLGALLTQFFLLVIYLIVMVIISWKLTIFILIIFPALHYVSNWLIKKIEKTSGFYAECEELLSNKITNILGGISLVKLYTTEEKEKKYFASMSGQKEALEFSIDKKKNLLVPIQEIIVLSGILFLLSAMAFMVVKNKSGSVGGFLVFFYVIKKLQSVVGSLNNIKASLATVSGPMAEIVGILDDKDKFFVPEGKYNFTGLTRAIEFKQLNFSYKDGIRVIKDMTFSVEKGSLVAIVGPTGAGKSTIFNLILRFYDCPPGSIFVDGIDIGEFSVASLRSHIAFVGQEPMLFNDTVRNNIIYGLDEKMDDEKIFTALKRARLYDFIIGLPDGLDSNIGDRGIKLSGGEKQRVSIARALLKGVHILMLDEATSSLDRKTEKLIQDAIDEVVKDRTVLVIAHRFSTIQRADKVIVIENGILAEEGSRQELFDKKGKFYEY